MGSWTIYDSPTADNDMILDAKRRVRMCDAKKGYSEKRARKLAARMGQRAYDCPMCPRWHLTTQNVDPEVFKERSRFRRGTSPRT